MGGASFWTDERTAELRRLWVEEKLSGAEIAKRMGLAHRNAIMGKVHRLGLTRGRNGEAGSDATDAVAAAAPKAPKKRSGASDAIQPETAAVPAPEPAVNEPKRGSREERAGDAHLLHPVLQLKERHCRWPIGDPQLPGFRFCCGERTAGTPYCRAHADEAYQTPEQKAARSAARRKAA